MEGWIESSQDHVFTASLLSHFQFWHIFKYVFFNLKNMVPGNCHLHEPVYFESYHLGNARQNIYTTAILLDYPQRVLPKKKIIFSNSLNLIFFEAWSWYKESIFIYIFAKEFLLDLSLYRKLHFIIN